jgi:DNA (cytosine-5)-methyltransferase 1
MKRSLKPKAIDLFSGSGGLTLGLKQAGFRVVSAVENDPLAVRTYRSNHRGVKVWHTDIRELPVSAVMRHHGLRAGELDLLAGCPPCQGFSRMTTLNGKNRMRHPQNRLVYDFLRFARRLRPKTVMLENVPGLLRSNQFRDVRRVLKQIGYTVKYAVLDAADYGVAQRRRRFVLIASRFVEIDFAPKSRVKPTVRKALRRLGKRALKDPLHMFGERRSAQVASLIRCIPKDGGSRFHLGNRKQLRCHRECDGFKDVYGRMAWDSPAPTITGGCVNPSKGRFLHPVENRTITLREAALLQSFPPSYLFCLDRGKFPAAQMIGNALPPEFVRRHARQVFRALAAS